MTALKFAPEKTTTKALRSGRGDFATATDFKTGMSAYEQTCRGRGWTVALRDGEDLRIRK